MGKFFRNATVFLLAGAASLSIAAPPKKPTNLAPRLNRPAIEEEALSRETKVPAATPDQRNFRQLSESQMPLAARGAIVIDGFSGRSIYEKNADAPQFPASTTKIMTGLMVIEEGDLEREIEITAEDARVGESSLYLKAGDRYTRRQMLYGLLLKSANDVAHSLGRDNAGTMEAFALKMTLRARELGATSTNFRNPHGLHATDHYTTPRDLALITRAAMQQPLFRKIVGTQEYPWKTNTALISLRNHNRLLWQFDGCTGVKTGYTRPAQQVLASAALRDFREVISIVMHTDKPGIWEDSKLLLTRGFSNPPTSQELAAQAVSQGEAM